MKTTRRTFLKALVLAPAAVAAPGLTLASPRSRLLEPSPAVAGSGQPGARRTNFAALSDEQKQAWSKALWKETQKKSLIHQFIGDDKVIQTNFRQEARDKLAIWTSERMDDEIFKVLT